MLVSAGRKVDRSASAQVLIIGGIGVSGIRAVHGVDGDFVGGQLAARSHYSADSVPRHGGDPHCT